MTRAGTHRGPVIGTSIPNPVKQIEHVSPRAGATYRRSDQIIPIGSPDQNDLVSAWITRQSRSSFNFPVTSCVRCEERQGSVGRPRTLFFSPPHVCPSGSLLVSTRRSLRAAPLAGAR